MSPLHQQLPISGMRKPRGCRSMRKHARNTSSLHVPISTSQDSRGPNACVHHRLARGQRTTRPFGVDSRMALSLCSHPITVHSSTTTVKTGKKSVLSEEYPEGRFRYIPNGCPGVETLPTDPWVEWLILIVLVMRKLWLLVRCHWIRILVRRLHCAIGTVALSL